jgi:hypothetical protein
MALTQAQKAALKAHALANQATVEAGGGTASIASLFAAGFLNSGDAQLISDWYNGFGPAGTHTVWKSNVSITEIGDAINAAELAGLTSLNNTRLQTLVALSSGGVNPSLANRRVFFDDIFSGAGGTNTRAMLLTLWKRLCREVEKVFATGTGSDASPATLAFEGTVSGNDISDIHGIP